MKTDCYPESKAVKVWEYDDGVVYSIVPYGHYCGYCRFPKRPLIEQGYNGIAAYVPVHGGITYAEEAKDGSMVYGFDCAHSGDEERPELRDLAWLSKECERMAEGVKLAAEYEKRYLTSVTNEETAKVLDEYHTKLRDKGITFDLRDNFGAMLRVLCGNLK